MIRLMQLLVYICDKYCVQRIQGRKVVPCEKKKDYYRRGKCYDKVVFRTHYRRARRARTCVPSITIAAVTRDEKMTFGMRRTIEPTFGSLSVKRLVAPTTSGITKEKINMLVLIRVDIFFVKVCRKAVKSSLSNFPSWFLSNFWK